MQIDYNDYEYNQIVKDILSREEFQKLKNCKHHTTSRFEHSKRVSYFAYKICKFLHFDYVSATRGGLLHDFFTEEYQDCNKVSLLSNHPKLALANAKKYFPLNDIEKNIIASHMFPVTMKVLPKYKESIIITIVDKIACVYEKSKGYKSLLDYKLGTLCIYLFLVVTSQ